MKDYALYPAQSISMSNDEIFKATIDSIFKNNKIDFIVESGTFKGTGSTTTLANAVIKNNAPVKAFYTIEVHRKFYKAAVKNLKQFKFIKPVWGLSINKQKAIDFIKKDDAINHHEKYPDVYIDTLENPVQFYISEVDGRLSTHKQSLLHKIFSPGNSSRFTENVFEKILPQVAASTSLILLDSAGGIGYLEFLSAIEYLKNSNYFIILDDIHHLKHFRSLQYLQSASEFELIAMSKNEGWAIAKHFIR